MSTVTVTLSVFEHPSALVTVSVYVVVADGFALGAATSEALSPEVDVQAYVPFDCLI